MQDQQDQEKASTEGENKSKNQLQFAKPEYMANYLNELLFKKMKDSGMVLSREQEDRLSVVLENNLPPMVHNYTANKIAELQQQKVENSSEDGKYTIVLDAPGIIAASTALRSIEFYHSLLENQVIDNLPETEGENKEPVVIDSTHPAFPHMEKKMLNGRTAEIVESQIPY